MNLENALGTEEVLQNIDKFKRIFFFRVCGTGMGASACLLKEAGYEIEGADTAFFPPMSDYLKATDIPCHKLEDVDSAFLRQFDLIIVGNSVPRNSEHARMIENSSVPFASFPSVLGAMVLKDKEVVGIAGTHGKTTTTYFLTQMLEKLGEDCGYLIGGIMEGRPPARIGKSRFFVIESDEYDCAYFQKIAKFRQYELNHMLLTSLEFDHADIYSKVEDIEDEFRAALPALPGVVVANDGYDSIFKLKAEFSKHEWLMYGDASEAGPQKIQSAADGSSFVLNWKGDELRLRTNVIGKHNIHNISACALFLLKAGFEPARVVEAVERLELVKRRQEARGLYQGAVVIDDFAHHPKAVTLTLDAIKAAYPGKEIVTVFEPVSATARSSIFQKEFAESLLGAGKVIVASNSLKTTVKGADNLDCQQLADELNSNGVEAFCAFDLPQLRERIDLWTGEDAVLLVLSNRTCLGLWESDFVSEIV